VRGRKRALEELQSFTAASIDELKQQQDGEFLQGETFRRPCSCSAVFSTWSDQFADAEMQCKL
jgi:hypothetical protein